MFRITGGKGFHITFKNGYTVSVQFGPGNHCEHKDRDFGHDSSAVCGAEGSESAEIAVMDPNGDFISWKGDDVLGWQSAEDLLNIMAMAVSGHLLPNNKWALYKKDKT
jgi:hypothetical protein